MCHKKNQEVRQKENTKTERKQTKEKKKLKNNYKFKSGKLVELVGGGSVINGATLSSF